MKILNEMADRWVENYYHADRKMNVFDCAQHLKDIAKPFFSVGVMKTSVGVDYYVMFTCGERSKSIDMNKNYNRALYFVDRNNWILNGGEPPNLLDPRYSDENHDGSLYNDWLD